MLDLKSISKELQDAVRSVLEAKKDVQVDEALKGNQHKIDANKNGKIDAQDFKLLKKKPMAEEEQVDEARFKKGEDIGKPGKNFAKIAKAAASKYGSKEAGQRVAGAVLKKVLAKEDVDTDADEILMVAPIVVDLKEAYTFGDYLTAAKAIVGEEQAIELANFAFNKQDTNLFVEQATRGDIESKIASHKAAGHIVSEPKYKTKDGKLHAEYVVTDKESGIRRKYIQHGTSRKVENMGTKGKKDEE